MTGTSSTRTVVLPAAEWSPGTPAQVQSVPKLSAEMVTKREVSCVMTTIQRVEMGVLGVVSFKLGLLVWASRRPASLTLQAT